MTPCLDALIADLEALLNGSLDSNEFRRRHSIKDEREVHVGEILCRLDHYLDDADIRARDYEYSEMQNSELKKLIEALRVGDIDRAARIHFLGHSE